MYDTVLILLPLALLAKAIYVALLGAGRGPSPTQGLDFIPTTVKQLVKVNDQLVTLFGIVFTTVIATLVRRYALWKAQKGAIVAELE